MPQDLPTQTMLERMTSALASASAEVKRTASLLIDAGRANLKELEAAAEQDKNARVQLDAVEKRTATLQAANDHLQKQFDERAAQTMRLDSELKIAQAQLAANATLIAGLHSTIAELQDRTKATSGSGSRPVADLIGELRADAAHLFATPFRAADAAAGAGVVLDNLEFEIRGDLSIGEKIGIRTFAPDRAGPEGASVLRFSIKPEMRVMIPDEEKK